MRLITIILLSFSCIIYGQTIYNPQQFYDSPGGFFDEDSLRSVYLNFYDNDYHSILVDAWFYNPSYRIPCLLYTSPSPRD